MAKYQSLLGSPDTRGAWKKLMTQGRTGFQLETSPQVDVGVKAREMD